MRLVSLMLLAACELAAQATVRPVPPPAGHPLAVDPIVAVTYSDGYQAFGSLTYPVVPPPPNGWPLVVFVHPLGSTRADDPALQMQIAGQGYVVWSYDVRAHGQSLLANPTHPNAGSTLWGPVERCDLAEQILFVANAPNWAALVDETRVAVVGTSQGGVHAWNAAAWSGKPLNVPGRTPLTFPTISCAVANDYVAEPTEDWLREGTYWSSWFLEAIAGSYAGLPIDPTLSAAATSAFLSQSPQQLAAYFASEGRGIAAELQNSSVPVMYSHAYHDRIDSPMPTLDLLQTMSAPRRVLMSTVGHNTPSNDAEREYRDGLALRWLHRYLWNEANEVDQEATYVLSEIPLPRTLREDPAYAWSRHHGGDPLAAGPSTRLWLDASGQLAPVQPAGPQAPASVVQALNPLLTFTAQSYLYAPGARDLVNVLRACPLDEELYTTVLPNETQLVRSPTLHLRVTPQDPDWMLAALLTVQAPNTQEEVMLSSRGFGNTASTPGVVEEHDVSLPPIAARIPAGSTIRLRIRNLWLREAPMARYLEVAPRFHSFQVDIQHDDGIGRSWLDLPLEPVRPKLATETTWYDLAAAPTVDLRLRGGLGRAGLLYYITLGLSGHVPGTPFLNDVLPIETDWLSGVGMGSIQSLQFVGFLGFLDQRGEGVGTLDFSSFAPLPPELTGLRMTFASFVFDPSLVSGAASNPCDLFLR